MSLASLFEQARTVKRRREETGDMYTCPFCGHGYTQMFESRALVKERCVVCAGYGKRAKQALDYVQALLERPEQVSTEEVSLLTEEWQENFRVARLLARGAEEEA